MTYEKAKALLNAVRDELAERSRGMNMCDYLCHAGLYRVSVSINGVSLSDIISEDFNDAEYEDNYNDNVKAYAGKIVVNVIKVGVVSAIKKSRDTMVIYGEDGVSHCAEEVCSIDGVAAIEALVNAQ